LSPELLHNYVRVLCLAGEVDRARDTIRSFLCLKDATTTIDDGVGDKDDEGGEDDLPVRHKWTDVSLETLALLSSHYVRSNDEENVKEVMDMCFKAGYTNGLPSYATGRTTTSSSTRRMVGGI